MIPQSNLISPTAPLSEALQRLNDLSGRGVMTLLAVDCDRRLRGTLTDGDIRRALLSGVDMSARVADVMRPDFRYLRADCHQPELMKEYRRLGLKLIPVLDANGVLIDVIDTDVTPSRLPVRAVLMAGGRGERLRPLTLDTPKPLLPIAGRPVIDYNIRLLSRAGISDVTVTVNYLAEQIERHFAEAVEGIQVKTLREPAPLGTVGAVALLEEAGPGTTLIMNSDLLTSISLEDMYLTHARTHNDITIAAIPYNISVPYAILHTAADGRVESLEEKPDLSFYANAGIYLASDSALALIPRGQRFDATDMVDAALAANLKVGYFPHAGTWIDIGSPADYDRADELMSNPVV